MRLQIAVCRFQIVGMVLLSVLLIGCASSKPGHVTDPEVARLAGTARIAFEKGSVEQAVRLYGRALDMARAQDDAVETGNNAYNLAACMMALGKNEDANALLEEARRDFERAGQDTAYVILSEVDLARQMQHMDEARALLDQLSSRKAGLTDDVKVRVAVRRGLLACDRRDVEKARSALADARASMKRLNDDFLEGQVMGLSARLFLMSNEPAKAGAEYDAQAEAFRRAGRYGDMASALNRAGKAYEDAAVLMMAGERYYRAARSLFAQGDDVAALKIIERALDIAQKTSDKDLLSRTTSLFREIKQRVKEASTAPETAKP
jgi:tetratricopeptide (TPR) repeat protein